MMAIADHTREFAPGRVYIPTDETTSYWIRGQTIVYRGYPLKGADVESFRFYLGGFGKDRQHCYAASTRLTGGHGPTFRALNYAYATDGKSVWTLGGKIKEADPESFVVCDDGLPLGGLRAPYGFGKDKNRVFYYDFDGKANWVRKASPGSFSSLNDGYFGKDDAAVFCGPAALPKVNVQAWRKIGGFYSQDDARTYYFNRLIRDADHQSFEVVTTSRPWMQMARDKSRFYNNDRIIDPAEFEILITG